jgi:hypothetical protein
MAQVQYAPLRKQSPPDQRWSISGQVDWHEWDGEFVVRANGSAITYLLSPFAGQVLTALRAGARHADEVARRLHVQRLQSGSAAAVTLASVFAVPEADVPQVAAVLAELETLGIVQVDRT